MYGRFGGIDIVSIKEDYEKAEESVKLIHRINPKKIYCGHGKMFGW